MLVSGALRRPSTLLPPTLAPVRPFRTCGRQDLPLSSCDAYSHRAHSRRFRLSEPQAGMALLVLADVHILGSHLHSRCDRDARNGSSSSSFLLVTVDITMCLVRPRPPAEACTEAPETVGRLRPLHDHLRPGAPLTLPRPHARQPDAAIPFALSFLARPSDPVTLLCPR